MSHFSVLVIGPDHEAQLAPYHEFECTGQDDQYVHDVDMTEEIRAEHAKETMNMLEGPDGERVDRFDDRFHRDPTEEELRRIGPIAGTGAAHGMSWHSKDWGDGRGYRAKVHYVPDGWKDVEVPMSEIKTLLEYIDYAYSWSVLRPGEERTEEHKYGFVEVDAESEVVRCVRRTNPDKQWDWYVVGGRWCGFFPLKPGAEGVAGQGAGAAHDLRPEPGTADHLRKGNVDFDRARDEAEAEGRERFAKWRAVYEKHGKPEMGWAEARRKMDEEIAEMEAKGIAEEKVPHPDPREGGREIYREGVARHTWRQRYNEQPAIAASRDFTWECPVDEYGFDEDVYAQKCRDRALVPYALVKDGKWYAKGEMGWWGVSHDTREQADWNQEVSRLYDDLPPDTMLTLVDCHI